MPKDVDANVVTLVADDDQGRVIQCIEVGYSTAKRVTNYDKTVTISGDDYSPASFKLGELISTHNGQDEVQITAYHDPEDAAGWFRLDQAQDTANGTITCIVYEVFLDTAAGMKAHEVFNGIVGELEGGPTSVSFVATQNHGGVSRPGNYTCWTDEFPHLPEPGLIVKVGELAAAIPDAPPWRRRH